MNMLTIMDEEAESANNTLATLSMVKQFHTDGKYCDVQLQIDGELFKCQRSLLAAISEYFDTMFSSDYKESNTTSDQPIILHEMDATAFKEILHFIYTGDVRVNNSNVCQLLLMNDFLRLRTPHVKEKCIKCVRTLLSEEHIPPTVDVINLFSFAYMKMDNILIDILNAHICQHLHYYARSAKFLEISFESLNALLKFAKNYILAFYGSQNVVLKIVLNWVNQNREDRRKYRRELLKNIKFSKISDEFMSLLINTLENMADEITGLPTNTKSLGKLKTLKSGITENLCHTINVRDDQCHGTLTLVVTPVSEVRIGNRLTVFSPSCKISHLSWRIGIMRSTVNNLSFYLYCDGTSNKGVFWNCCVSANFSIVSQKEGKDNLVRKLSHHIFSYGQRNKSKGFECFLNWQDVIDPEKGYIKDNSITLRVEVHAGIPFEKQII